MRLIDADELLTKLDRLEAVKGHAIYRKALNDALHDFFPQIIADMPTLAPPPNDPLTLEELREMDVGPMWISGEGFGRYDICCGISSDNVVQFYKVALPIYSYGRTWLAYRRKPEEVQNETKND